MRKIAVILLNLGGPDRLDAVRPFLFNLFNDKSIIQAPQPLRATLALTISVLRARTARANYALIGGASPLLGETQAQAAALQERLAGSAEAEFRVFVAMRYWNPQSRETAAAARAWGADEAMLVPLYPQYSTSTTGSSVEAWRAVWRAPVKILCCYPCGGAFAQAHADAIMAAWREGGCPPNPRILFSAHGLPKRTIDGGDPYQWQVERTCAAVSALLPPDWTTRICYQSRVGPLEWIGPSTEHEIDAAISDEVGVIVAPIAFVSEHVETLVELDRDYRARAAPLSFYLRAKTLGVADGFIDTLARQCRRLAAGPAAVSCEGGARLCPAPFVQCPNRGFEP